MNIERAFPELNIMVVILSRGRPNLITTHKIAPFATLVVPESQVDQYKYLNMPIVPIPDKYEGLGPVRNWVADNFTEHAIVMMDDDIVKLWCNVGMLGTEITDPQYVFTILETAAMCASDLGTSCFGFSQTWDVRQYNASKPFSLCDWFGGVFGMIGRRHRFLSCNKLKVDVDYCLETIQAERRVWRDNRYSFKQYRNNMVGGNSEFRSEAMVERELTLLKNKWGKYFGHKRMEKSAKWCGEATSIHVERKQTIKVLGNHGK